MNIFWKTLLMGFLGIAAIVGGRYSAAWIANNTYRAPPMTQAERVRLKNEAIDRVIERSYAQTRNTPEATYTPPRPFDRPPRNYNTR